MNIDGSVALVTGANRGIGAATVAALVKAGARKVYAGTRNPDAMIESSTVVPVALDVTNAEQILAVASQCDDVQILVNNAGIAKGQPALNARDLDAAEQEMRVNYFGTLNMCRAFAPILASGGGAIVNVLSILGRVNLPRVGSYSATKAAAYSLTQALRAELPETLVIGVFPAFVATDMARHVPFPKLAPEEVAAQIVMALQSDVEDVYPGEAAEIADRLGRDPKAVERQFATMFSPMRPD